jgi:hypothetical protein
MIDHVIMFKASELGPDGQEELFDKLATLEEIPGVVAFALGKNFGDRSRGFDYCMRITFESRADLDAYQEHPHHLEIVAYNRAVTEEHICVDFEWRS